MAASDEPEEGELEEGELEGELLPISAEPEEPVQAAQLPEGEQPQVQVPSASVPSAASSPHTVDAGHWPIAGARYMQAPMMVGYYDRGEYPGSYSANGVGGHVGNGRHPRHDRSEEDIKAREEREKEQLTSSIRELTRYASVQDVIRNAEAVCADLRSALKKVDKLARLSKTARADSLDELPEVVRSSKRLLDGLRSVQIVAGTSGGSARNLDLSCQLFRSAWLYRHDVFSTSQKDDLERLIRSSKPLKVVLEDPNKPKAVEARPAAAVQEPKRFGSKGDEASGAAARTASPAAEQQGPTSASSQPAAALQPLADSTPPPPPVAPDAGGGGTGGTAEEAPKAGTDWVTDMYTAMSQSCPAAEPSESDEDVPPPPPPPPPPPEEPPAPPAYAHDSYSHGYDSYSHHASAQGSQAGPTFADPWSYASLLAASSARAAAAAADKANKFKFNIVVQSTAADIRKPTASQELQQQQQQAETAAAVGPTSVDDTAAQTSSSSAVGYAPITAEASASVAAAHRSTDSVPASQPGAADGAGGSKRSHAAAAATLDGDDEHLNVKRHRASQSAAAGGDEGELGVSDFGWGQQVGHSPHVRSRTRVSAARSSAATNGHHAIPSTSAVEPPPSPLDASDLLEDEALLRFTGHHVGTTRLDGRGVGDDSASMHGCGAVGGGRTLPVLDSSGSALGEEVLSLLRHNKLCLVLDLDHTLLNSARFQEIDTQHDALLRQRLEVEQQQHDEAVVAAAASGGTFSADHLAERELFRLDALGMWTKLRPGVHEFLRRAAALAELWIHTNGNAAYAKAMVALLDPTGELFGSRVIAQGSAGQDEAAAAQSKRLMAGLEGREPIVTILDDSSAVWPHDRRNLVVVERYVYFACSRKRFGIEGKSLLESGRDECSKRGMLMTALGVLERLHAAAFTYWHHPSLAPSPSSAQLPLSTADDGAPSEPHAPWDMRNVIAEERRRVLAGTHLVFSRVIPLEQEPRSHPLWRMAEQCGAVCSTAVSDATTHVVATTRGTEKTFWAASNGKHVVTPAWVECSCILWRRAPEDRYATPQ